ncbi:hypothetical protein ABIF74_004509 [Bradyrhizobium japonicum]
MDRLEALVAIAHLRLRLVMIERNPQLLEGTTMQIKRPIELAGLKGRLVRARQTEASIAVTGERFDAALDGIDEAHAAARAHVGELERLGADLRQTIEGMTGGLEWRPKRWRELLDRVRRWRPGDHLRA